MSIHELSTRIAGYIAQETHKDYRIENRMSFGLELFLGTLIKIFIITILAYCLGILKETLVITITAGTLRLASGGEHCSEYYRCLVGGTICFLLLGWGARSLNHLLFYSSIDSIVLPLTIIFLITISALWKYAPADTANKPITKEDEIAKYKKWSLIMATLFFGMAVLFSRIGMLREYSLIITIGVLEQTFTVTPWGYSFIRFIDNMLGKATIESQA